MIIRILCSHLSRKPGLLGRILAVFFLVVTPGVGQQKLDLNGDYSGSLGPHPVKLHLRVKSDGGLAGTVDSPDYALLGLACAGFHLDGQTLSFTVPIVRGTWVGLVDGNGASLAGTWSQGAPMPLNFTRVATATSETRNAPQAGSAATSPHVLDFLGSGEFDRDGFSFVKQESVFHVRATVTDPPQDVGEIILTPTGPNNTAVPNYDMVKPGYARSVRAAFERLSTADSTSQTSGATSTTPPTTIEHVAHVQQEPGFFDAASQSLTVPLDDGETVTFLKDKTVTLAGGSASAVMPYPTYFVIHRKGSGKGFGPKLGEAVGGYDGVSAGGKSSLAGGGPVITMGSKDGAVIYDDLRGTSYPGQNQIAKMVAKEILKAAERVDREDSQHSDLLPRQVLGEMKALADLRN